MLLRKKKAKRMKNQQQQIKEQITVPKWKSRTEETNTKYILQLQTDKYKQSQILLLGDSMFERWLTSGTQYWNLYEIESKLNVFNASIGGDGIQNVLWRLLQTPFGKILSSLPNLHSIILLIGTNNIEKYSDEQVAEAIQVLVQQLRELCTNNIQIHVLSILPRKEPVNINKKIIACNSLIEKWCSSQQNVHFVSLYYLFCESNNDEKCKTEIFEDHVHLNQKGYGYWMKFQFFEFLQQLAHQQHPK